MRPGGGQRITKMPEIHRGGDPPRGAAAREQDDTPRPRRRPQWASGKAMGAAPFVVRPHATDATVPPSGEHATAAPRDGGKNQPAQLAAATRFSRSAATASRRRAESASATAVNWRKVRPSGREPSIERGTDRIARYGQDRKRDGPVASACVLRGRCRPGTAASTAGRTGAAHEASGLGASPPPRTLRTRPVQRVEARTRSPPWCRPPRAEHGLDARTTAVVRGT